MNAVIAVILSVLMAVLSARFITTGELPMLLILASAPLLFFATLSAFKKPQLLGYFLVIILYANLDVYLSHTTHSRLAFIWLIMDMVYLFLLMLLRERRTPIGTPLKIFTVFFTVSGGTSAILPAVDGMDLYGWVSTIGYAYCAMLVAYFLLCSAQRMVTLSKILTWVGVILSVINFIEFMDSDLISLSTVPGRSAGLLLNANASAAAILACLIVSYFTHQRLALVVRVIMSVGIYTTYSRSALMLLILFLVVNELAIEKLTFRRVIVSGALFFSVLMFFTYNEVVMSYSTNRLTAISHNRIVQASQGRFDDSSANHRLKVIGVNFERFRERPILGNGAGSSNGPDSPHNMFLLVLAEHGAVGIVLWMAFLVSLLYRLYCLAPGIEKRVLFSLYVFQVLNMWFTHNQYHVRAYMIVFAILCAGAEIYPTRQRQSLPATSASLRIRGQRRPLGSPAPATVSANVST